MDVHSSHVAAMLSQNNANMRGSPTLAMHDRCRRMSLKMRSQKDASNPLLLQQISLRSFAAPQLRATPA
eukprot:CAMPEP_0177379970 /NCGR_PEP_ID=MMETSP0368-20130122/47240_1 /TAXON_ID=447022 ORGANISM="Scrippsiella hangoei-like, Strain SHHI-4" /NCGR_SAMPLE_ID=MMETSP0368 /ASSEMBLY_ACC=CAM_ASM_000363 /LENGTH=68 /DNA_ID=CAMNT_0018844199 /DNA_START=172 /DNA_END=374 /DNA_ORIENTATION=+